MRFMTVHGTLAPATSSSPESRTFTTPGCVTSADASTSRCREARAFWSSTRCGCSTLTTSGWSRSASGSAGSVISAVASGSTSVSDPDSAADSPSTSDSASEPDPPSLLSEPSPEPASSAVASSAFGSSASAASPSEPASSAPGAPAAPVTSATPDAVSSSAGLGSGTTTRCAS